MDHRARQRSIIENCYFLKADVLFMQLQTPTVVDPSTLKEVRDMGVMVINWTGDVRDPIPQHYIDLAPHVDITAFTNHPDVLTMREYSDKPMHDISYAYLGDARNNTGNSLLLIGAKLGMDVRIAAPKAFWPHDEFVAQCKKCAEESGAKLTLTEDPKQAAKNVDFVHTDVWVSMGEPAQAWGERINALLPYQVNMAIMKAAGNPRVKFMHCLPAFHNSETKVGKQIAEQYPNLANGIEVTEDVFESPYNIAFEQAQNRVHTIKAILVSTLADI
jgi:ornithine carbamoyltransferase